jgi:hypothetical protein
LFHENFKKNDVGLVDFLAQSSGENKQASSDISAKIVAFFSLAPTLQ